MRIRAYNVGSTKPGAWSAEVHVGSEEEEKNAKVIQARLRGTRCRQSVKCLANADGVASQGGAAVVEQEDLSQMAEKSLAMKKRRKSRAAGGSGGWKGWSPFRQAVGEFYEEVGVPGGADGKLFDLSAQQVEEMSKDPATMDVEGASSAKPLTTLACAGVWVMETLAHFTDETSQAPLRPPALPSTLHTSTHRSPFRTTHPPSTFSPFPHQGDWIELITDIDGLVNLCVKAGLADDPETFHLQKELLFAIIAIYETMRQCEEDGFITRNLKHKYPDSKLRPSLKADLAERFEKLRCEVP